MTVSALSKDGLLLLEPVVPRPTMTSSQWYLPLRSSPVPRTSYWVRAPGGLRHPRELSLLSRYSCPCYHLGRSHVGPVSSHLSWFGPGLDLAIVYVVVGDGRLPRVPRRLVPGHVEAPARVLRRRYPRRGRRGFGGSFTSGNVDASLLFEALPPALSSTFTLTVYSAVRLVTRRNLVASASLQMPRSLKLDFARSGRWRLTMREQGRVTAPRGCRSTNCPNSSSVRT